ncbi:MAG TPA: RodZ domain-containing protein [Bryobacteraceae bacterium]|nr:RodZ domain-containing protein [Bryobacteraceae bacterium]
MLSIGDRLRRERLRRGLDIDQLAEQTKINAAMLEAIEADDLDRLPGSFFTRSFVRQYAKALELDDEEFETELKRVTGGEEPAVPEFPVPSADLGLPPVTPGVSSHGRSHHSLSSLIAFVLIVAACTGIYTLWQKSRDDSREEARRSAAAHQNQAASKPAPPPQAAPPAAQPAAGTPGETVAAQTPEAAPAQAPPAESAAPTPAPETPAAAPAETGPVAVQVHTTAEAWMRVTADGVNLYTGLLQPNESRNFAGKERMSILFGDPSAVEVTWNGKAVGTIGPQGKPRVVQFTPQSYRIVNPAPPKPPAPSDEP